MSTQPAQRASTTETMSPEHGVADPLEEQISTWLAHYLADLFDLPIDEVDPSMAFERYGMDSSAAVALSGDLGNWLGCSLEPTLAYDHPSINALAKALTSNAKVVAAARAGHVADVGSKV